MPGPLQPDPRSDHELVAAINAGDADAFEALYHRHRDYALKLAMRFCGERSLALDAVQDSFIYVYKKFPGFVLTAKFTTFLYPVVKHNALTAKKKARRTQGQTGGGDAGDGDPLGRRADTRAPDPARDFDDAPGSGVAKLVASLPEAQREVLMLRFVDELPLEEIAQALEIPLGTVKTRIHHAVRKLRDDPATKKFFAP
ncbi:MAG: RNA polymerase sigma factor [Planctomycetota bacterium]